MHVINVMAIMAIGLIVINYTLEAITWLICKISDIVFGNDADDDDDETNEET